MSARADIAVVGAGAWGQALAITLARRGHRVALWARRPESVLDAAGSSRRLPGLRLPAAVALTGDLPDAAQAVLVAVPVQHLRPVLAALPGSAPLVFCAKGIEAGTLALPGEIAAATCPGRATAVLGGPNFAHEIAAGLPAAAVLAAGTIGEAETLAGLVGSAHFRVYGGDDPVGAAIGGAAKNVIAIAAGIASGAALGQNARAALVTRGLAEIARLVVGAGGRAETAFGLAGAGDLLLTCTGEASRNFRVGAALGRGEELATILGGRDDVAEGVATAPALVARARRHGVDLPIAAMVARLLAGDLRVEAAVETLLARPAGRE